MLNINIHIFLSFSEIVLLPNVKEQNEQNVRFAISYFYKIFKRTSK